MCLRGGCTFHCPCVRICCHDGHLICHGDGDGSRGVDVHVWFCGVHEG